MRDRPNRVEGSTPIDAAHGARAVHVSPEAPDELIQAVTEGGGEVVGIDDASALIWFGRGPQDAKEYLHDGIRWMQLPGAGVETWAASGLLTDDRIYTSATGLYATAVAEHALALMLAGARRLPELARARTWTRPAPRPVYGSTVAVVGAGGIGRELIRLLEPFDVRVLAITRSGRQVPGAAVSATPDRLLQVVAEADFVVVAAPSTAETEAMIGKRELAAMRESAWLVNIARGSLIDTDALAEAVRSGVIGGAALDVTDPEPLPHGHPLWDEPHALITPHSANPMSLLLPQLAGRVRRNVENFIAGRPLEGIVDIDAGY